METEFDEKQTGYPDIFRGRDFDFFLYRQEILDGFWDFLVKNLGKFKNFSKWGRGFDPRNPLMNTPLNPAFYSILNNNYSMLLQKL